MHETPVVPPVHAIAAITHPDPCPWYRQGREDAPLYLDAGLQLRIASSHALIHEALHHPALQVRPPGEPVASPARVALASSAAQALMAQGRDERLDTVQAAQRIALMLAQHPQLAAAADHSLQAMRAFVAEVEGRQAPIQNTRRFAAQALRLDGRPLEKGQGVLLVLASGKRQARRSAECAA